MQTTNIHIRIGSICRVGNLGQPCVVTSTRHGIEIDVHDTQTGHVIGSTTCLSQETIEVMGDGPDTTPRYICEVCGHDHTDSAEGDFDDGVWCQCPTTCDECGENEIRWMSPKRVSTFVPFIEEERMSVEQEQWNHTHSTAIAEDKYRDAVAESKRRRAQGRRY